MSHLIWIICRFTEIKKLYLGNWKFFARLYHMHKYTVRNKSRSNEAIGVSIFWIHSTSNDLSLRPCRKKALNCTTFNNLKYSYVGARSDAPKRNYPQYHKWPLVTFPVTFSVEESTRRSTHPRDLYLSFSVESRIPTKFIFKEVL